MGKLNESQVAEIGDISFKGSYQYIVRNGVDPLSERYEEVRDALMDLAKQNLAQTNTVTLLFLCLESGLLALSSAYLLHRNLRLVMRRRVMRMAMLLAVPKALSVEMFRRPVVMDGDAAGEDEEEPLAGGGLGSGSKGSGANEKRSGASAKTIRAILSRKITTDRIHGEG